MWPNEMVGEVSCRTILRGMFDRLTGSSSMRFVSHPQLHWETIWQLPDVNDRGCTERTLICRLVALADCTERTRGVSSMSWALDHSLKFTRYVLRFRRPLATTATIASSSYPFHTGPTYWDTRVWGVVSTTTNRAAGDHLTHAIRAPPLKHTLPSVQG
jgi:hypothetical protein